MLVLCKVKLLTLLKLTFNNRTWETETSKYPKENKLKKILIVTVSEIKLEQKYQVIHFKLERL